MEDSKASSSLGVENREGYPRLTWILIQGHTASSSSWFGAPAPEPRPENPPILGFFPQPHWSSYPRFEFRMAVSASLRPREICISFWGPETTSVQYGCVVSGPGSEESCWRGISINPRKWASYLGELHLFSVRCTRSHGGHVISTQPSSEQVGD